MNISDIVNIAPSEGYNPNGLSYNWWGFSDVVSISDGKINAKKPGTTTGNIQLLRNGSGITSTTCTITVVDDPNNPYPTGISIASMSMMVGESATAIVSPLPAAAKLDGIQIAYNNGNNDLWANGVKIATIAQDGTITAIAAGQVGVHAEGGGLATDFDVYIVNGETNINGRDFNNTPWKDLRDYIIQQNKEPSDEKLPAAQLYAARVNWAQKTYILRPGAVLPWKESYSLQMSFEDYLKENSGQFIELKNDTLKYPIQDWQLGLEEGKIYMSNSGEYYVYTGSPRNFDKNWETQEDLLLQNDFVKIS